MRRIRKMCVVFGLTAAALGVSLASVHASPQSVPPAAPAGTPSAGPPAGPAVSPFPDYVIGPDDVLTVTFWRDKDVSGDVVVRPDGKISVMLINDIQAAGLTPEQLRLNLLEARKQFEEDPTVWVQVKQINSRKVFITGQVAKPGPYPLTDTTTVLQLISKAGGLTEFADKKHIVVLRESRTGGPPVSFTINYNDFWDPKKLKSMQNLELKSGDTVIVK